jgi:hypothetical protein
MKKSSGLHLLMVLALFGCKSQEDLDSERDQRIIADAEAAVRKNALDPAAVQFRDEKVSLYVPEGKTGTRRVVCGEYNGKNAYGAYTGFKPFRYDTLEDEFTELSGMEYEIC